MADVVWAEIRRALIDEFGSVIFAAGRPDDFRKVCIRTTGGRETDTDGALRFAAPRHDAGVYSCSGVPGAVGAVGAGNADTHRVYVV